MSSSKRYLIIFVLVVGVFFASSQFSNKDPSSTYPYVSYTEFYKQVEEGNIMNVSQQTGTMQVVGQKTDGSFIRSNSPSSTDLLTVARAQGVSVDIKPAPGPGISSILTTLLMLLVPVLLLIGFFYWLHRRQSGNEGRAINNARQATALKNAKTNPEDNPVRMSDVAGCEEITLEVSEIIGFLKDADAYNRVGARSPKGVLMAGPPGTGKTLLAKAIAGESQVPFFSVSGSDFVEMFVGVGASRVRDLFEQAKAEAPCIVFIDEIDAIGRQRGGNNMQNSEEREQTLNQLLVEMDGFKPNAKIVVMAATNRSDVLDKALTRRGRFDREVTMSMPDFASRQKILTVHSKRVPLASDVDLETMARGTPGFSGADLENLVNEAAVLAARAKATLVHHNDFERARDKVIMGVERSPLKNEEERRTVAYHEAGHAIVAHFTQGSAPLYKISIVPRGNALGVTVQIPKEDSYNHSETKLLGDISILMGGRAAEDIALNQSTVGASNDFMRATSLARHMITTWGMDKEFGPMSADGFTSQEGFNLWSETTKQDVDVRVQRMLKKHYDKACELLRKNRDALDTVAQALLEKETIDAAEFNDLVNGLLDPSIPVPSNSSI